MENQHNIEEQLWNFIDGTVSNDEKPAIEHLLATNASWKATYKKLLEVNELLQASGLEAPSMRFTKNVMEEISNKYIRPAAKSYINKKIIWGLGFFFITLIIAFLVYGFAQMNFTDSSTSDTITKKIDTLDFSKFFNNTLVNVFMMINVVLGLFLLDNYLGNKRKQFRKEA